MAVTALMMKNDLRLAKIQKINHIGKWVALFEARSLSLAVPHATQTSGLCAVGLAQVKAAGLVRAFDPRPSAKALRLLGSRFRETRYFVSLQGRAGCLESGNETGYWYQFLGKKKNFFKGLFATKNSYNFVD